MPDQNNISEQILQLAEYYSLKLTSFIKSHSNAIKYQKMLNGYSLLTIEYGKYRDPEIFKIKDFINNTIYDNLLKINEIPITCIKVTDSVMIFKGKTSEIETYLIQNVENSDIFNIIYKVNVSNENEQLCIIKGLPLTILKTILIYFNTSNLFLESDNVKKTGIFYNPNDDESIKISIDIDKFNRYLKSKENYSQHTITEIVNSFNSNIGEIIVDQKYNFDFLNGYVFEDKDILIWKDIIVLLNYFKNMINYKYINEKFNNIYKIEIFSENFLIIKYSKNIINNLNNTTDNQSSSISKNGVSGVKGSNESEYRKGNVEINIEDIVNIGNNLELDTNTNTLSSTGGVDSEAREIAENASNLAQSNSNRLDQLPNGVIPKGTISFENVPSLDNVEIGWMYNISDDFTTTENFIKSGISCLSGTNIYCADVGNGVKKWDMFTVPPTVGNTSLQSSITSSMAVGGVTVGKSYEAGTSFETILRDLIDPVQYPTLSNPSASLSANPSSLLIETNGSASVKFTATLNRGSINPAYGTNGYRSGEATGYSLNNGTEQVSNVWNSVTVNSSNKTFTAVIKYAAGEQPKDSKGNNFNSPLAAGSVTSNTLTYEFVNALWANVTSISTVAKLGLVSKSTKTKTFNFKAATVANPEIFEVPASWSITAIEAYDTLNRVWVDCSSEFTITDTTEKDGGNVDTAYKRYTCNLGVPMGARDVKIKWS